MPPDRLLFVDTNIWLDFYRSQTGAGLSLLKHLEGVKDQIIMTYQVEIEFKGNRQRIIADSYTALKPPSQIPNPGYLGNAKAAKALVKDIKNAEKRVKALKKRLFRALNDPTHGDPVYQICQRCFHKTDEITLLRGTKIKRRIPNVREEIYAAEARPRAGSNRGGDADHQAGWLLARQVQVEAR